MLYLLQASICSSSISSSLASGSPCCMAATTVSTAALAVGKHTTAAATVSGRGWSLTVAAVMTPKVPSDPTNSPVRL